MEEYFNRQIQLWGLDTQKDLQNKHIVIIGCGGLGCSLGIALGASGIGKITLVDFDEVGVHNIHRQIGFRVGDEGEAKCDVLQKLLQDRCPYTQVDAINGSFDDFTLLEVEGVDLILDATDNLPTRASIDKYAKEKQIPWIYGSVEEFHGQVCFFDKASFDSVFSVKERTPNGIACPIVMNIASIQANFAIRYLCGYNVKKDFLNYVFYNDEGELILQKFGLPT
jgi:adenylyltransferase/sulfurtransferase